MSKHNEQSKAGRSAEGYEEISERKTSKLGYFLLTIMAIFLIVVGQTVFQDLKRLPEKPKRPANCVRRICYNNLENIRRMPDCRFTKIDKKFELDKRFNKLKPNLNNIISLNGQIKSVRNQIKSKEDELEKLRKKYDLSLQETIAAEETALMDKLGIKSTILSLRSAVSSLKENLSILQKERHVKIGRIAPEISNLKKLYDEALEYYKDRHAHYSLYVFLFSLAFVVPFFVISLLFYLKLKRRNSPYTIIHTAILCASSVLFMQVVIVFLYETLPSEWLKRIFRVFREIPYLRYILYYGSVLLIVAIFGGIVYYIQKKVFSPKSIAMRRLKNNKCPSCSFTLDSSHLICPKCGYELKEKCSHCGNLKICDLPYCPNCGEKETVSKEQA